MPIEWHLAGLADVVGGDAPGGKAADIERRSARRGQRGRPRVRRRRPGIQRRRDPSPGRRAARQERSARSRVATRTRRHDGIMSAYADFEAMIRAGQAAGRSVVSASGSILAMRPAFWRELPAGPHLRRPLHRPLRRQAGFARRLLP